MAAVNLELLRRRAEIIQQIRAYFTGAGYLEVDTPLLSPFLIPEGSLEVFTTRYRSAEQEARQLYLIPSPELWMKRLLAAGSGSIFQICRSFRNQEPLSAVHNPEFTMLEWYTVGADYLQSVETLESLLVYLFAELDSKPRFRFRGAEIDCSRPFLRLSMANLFAEHCGEDLSELMNDAALREAARRRGISTAADERWDDTFHKLFLGFVEPELPADRALILYDYPSLIPTLARNKPGTPWAERWELYLAGIEIANCYSEETDPERIEAFFLAQERRKRGAEVPHPADRELVRTIRRLGLPDCSGTALGVERLLLFFLGLDSVQDVFPYAADLLLRRPVTRES